MSDTGLFFNRHASLPFVEMRRADRSSACYHTHSHDEFTFGVIDAGEGDYQNLNRNSHIGRGTLVTINPGDPHACNPREGDWSYRMLFVDTEWVGQLQQEMFGGAQDYRPFQHIYQYDSDVFPAFDHLFSQLLLPGVQEPGAESLLIEFLEQRFRGHFALEAGVRRSDLGAVERARELIMDQLHQNIPLDQIGQSVGISRYHLIRSFKKAYGQSPHAYQLDQRIKRSCLMLQRGSSLAEIATELGFSDQAHFQRNFKKRMAVTPGYYQSFFI